MAAINTNVNALYSQGALTKNARVMNTAMEQLSTGTRVNSSKDDAAGMAIGQFMTSQIRGLNQAVRNANDGINMMQTAEGALNETTNMLQRMRELAVQSANGTNSDTQRGYLQVEFGKLSDQIDSIATKTTWNGMHVLDATNQNGLSSAAGTFVFQIGAESGQTISVAIDSMSVSGLGLSGLAISTASGASSAIASLGSALDIINNQRAVLGASINQISYAMDNLMSISQNTQTSRSSIMDTDYALATTQLAKTQIIQQAATAMLAQANQQPQTVMKLLQ